MKFFKLCSNPDCSPLAPMVVTVLRRKYFEDKTEYRCQSCKDNYDAVLLGTNVCPKIF